MKPRELLSSTSPQAPAADAPGTAVESRCLDAGQLKALESSFRTWAGSARRKADRLSRKRMWLIFLLLRSTGARLGEVLALDAGRDLDLTLSRPVAVFRSSAGAREAPLPADVAEELRRALADEELIRSLGPGGTAHMFDMDQGHVRRKFYERAADAGLPRELASPSVLRRSLARRLMRQSVPLPVVQRLLGQSSADLTAAFSDYTDDEAGRILEDYLKREERRKSSARNRFFGHISAVRRGPVMAEVELMSLGGFRVFAVVTHESVERLGIRAGVLATADVKATWVQLQAGEAEPTSTAANRYPGVVSRVETGAEDGGEEGVAAEVVADLSDGTRLAAVMTTESVRRLKLAVGSTVWASFGAFAVVLNLG